jgi:hypothetical protein
VQLKCYVWLAIAMAHVVTLQLLALVMQLDVYMSDACRHGQLIQLAQYTSARIGLNHCAVAPVGRSGGSR